MVLADEKSIAAAVKGGEVKSPILLFGSEEYLKQHYLSLLVGQGGALDSFNIMKMDFAGLDLQRLQDAVTTPPLLAPRKVVLLYDVVPKEINADLFKSLEKLLAGLYDDCRLLLLEKSGAVDDKKCEKSKKLIKLIDKYGTVLHLKERTETELQRFIKAEAKALGCAVEPAAAKLLLARCGRNILALRSELSKLCAYKAPEEGGQPAAITAGDVDALTPIPPEDNIYGLGKAVLRGDYDGAMRILSGLFYLKYPCESILGTLSQYYIDLVRAQAAAREGKPAAAVAADFGYGKRTFAVENALREQKKLPPAYLGGALDTLAKADLRLKSTQCEPRTVLEETVTALFLPDGGAAALGGSAR